MRATALPLVGLLLLAAPGGADDVAVQSLPSGLRPQTRQAIERGLEFLKREQAADGCWRSGGGYGQYPVVMTSLAGLSLIASGSTPTRGPYAPQVRRAANYVLAQQQASGLIAAVDEEQRSMYSHGFGTLFLSQVYGMEEDVRKQAKVKRALQAAVELIARAQSSDGGWYYTPDARTDEGSVTVTQVQALRGCRNAGIHVPKKVIDQAIRYIERSQQRDGGIAYRVNSRGSRPAISAAACAVLYNAGSYDSPAAERCFQYAWKTCKPLGGSSNGFYYYTQLYMSQATWQAGGNYWETYFRDIQDALLRTQQGNGAWQGDNAGLTYGTSIALLILQLPYTQLPILSR